MPKVRTTGDKPTRSSRPALSPEARLNQLIDKAYALAEKQIEEGTASSQVITHFLKMGTEKERLEQELLEKELALKQAKTEALQSAKHVEELYSEAIAAMRRYSGQGDPYEPNDEY